MLFLLKNCLRNIKYRISSNKGSKFGAKLVVGQSMKEGGAYFKGK